MAGGDFVGPARKNSGGLFLRALLAAHRFVTVLLTAVKAAAEHARMPYQRFIRQAIAPHRRRERQK